jgi:HlyD family secretion protein
MSKGRRVALIAVAIVALTILIFSTHGFGLWKRGTGDLILYGNVDIRQVDLGFRVSGRIAAMPLEEGAQVKAGTRLAMLDSRPLEDRLAAATAQLELAQADLDKRRHGNRPQEIAQASAALAQQQANLVKARADYERRKPLLESGAISQALLEQTQAAYRAAQAQVEAAQQLLSLQQAGARKEEVAAAEAQLASARAQHASAQTDLDDAVLLAPSDGTLLTRAREPGAIVQAGETVFTLTIDNPVRVRAYVAESDLSRIAPGMAVTVSVDGNPLRYQGSIGYISPTAEFTPKSVETESLRSDLVYRLRINVADADGRLRQGQPVSVSIVNAAAAKR